MKTIHRTLAGSLFLLLITCLCLISCGEDEDEYHFITIEETDYFIEATAIERNIEFQTRDSWTTAVEYLNGEKTDKEKEWLQIKNPQGGPGTWKLQLELKPNFTLTPRRADIRIHCNEETVTLHIEQGNLASGGDEDGDGDKNKKGRIKAIWCIEYVQGAADVWERKEFEYTADGKLSRLITGDGKMPSNLFEVANCLTYRYDYRQNQIHTQESSIIFNTPLIQGGDLANLDLGQAIASKPNEVQPSSYTVNLNSEGYASQTSGGYTYRYEDGRLVGVTFYWTDEGESEAAVIWADDNIKSYQTPYPTVYAYSSYLNNYNIDLNRYIEHDTFGGYIIPSDYLGARSKNILDMTEVEVDNKGRIVSFSRRDSYLDITRTFGIAYE